MIVDLAYEHYEGPGQPIIILHGLFGSGRNWVSHAKELSHHFDVFTIDHRNHGNSPWSDEHTLQAMTDDVLAFQSKYIKKPAIFLGHSMGGLVAMAAALKQPESVTALVIADIAPKPYERGHNQEFAALAIDVSTMESRSQVDAAMAKVHPQKTVRQFLQMNLERLSATDDHSPTGFRWKLNTKVLASAEYLSEFNSIEKQGKSYDGPALFVIGRSSSYVNDDDHQAIHKLFRNSQIHKIDGDHWLHYTNYQSFMAEVNQFLAPFQIGP